MSKSVILERDGAVATITLNRPDKLNSFTTEMTTALSEIFFALERDATCRAILLTGAGRAFCAGQDLSERTVAPGGAAPKVDVGASIERRFNPLIRRIRALPKPIVVAVNGVAAGAGANLALQGDIVLGAKSAKFIQSFVKIGLLPDCGGTWSLTHLLGEARAKALAMLAEPVSAEQAVQWGMIWKSVEDAELMGEANKLAAHLAAQPTQALAAIKKAIHFAATASMEASLDHERDAQRELGYSDDFAEGVAAFIGKRAPVFTGKG
jgi:2-(1,2-epoxy-1,2-dihydrophenyl)acetyl-CoA isomerase